MTVVMAIIAGGCATRLGGQTKPLLEVGGQRIIDRQLAVLRGCGDVVLSTNSPDEFAALQVPCVVDTVSGAGPLAGIAAVLQWAMPRPVFAIAGDMPHLSGPVIRGMIAMADDWDVVVPEVRGRLQPLHAFYGTACLNVVRRRLAEGRFRATDFATDVGLRVCRVGEDELGQWDPSFKFLANVNYPSDVA